MLASMCHAMPFYRALKKNIFQLIWCTSLLQITFLVNLLSDLDFFYALAIMFSWQTVTHGQIVDAELANQSARFALVLNQFN